MKRALIPIILISVLFFSSCTKEKLEAYHTYAFDTVVNISALKKDSETIKKALDLCPELENTFSRTLSESELSLINKKAISQLSEDMKEVLSFSLSFSALTDGAFDITVAPLTELWNVKERTAPPNSAEIEKARETVGYQKVSLSPLDTGNSKLDLGGVAKGYAADKITSHLKKSGVSKAIIDLGGNIALIGEFTVGIRNPHSPDSLYARLTLRDKSAVTSGAYQRYFEHNGRIYHHIIDPRTGECASSGLSSVTVISPSSMHADALSTAIYVLGEKGLSLCSSFPDTDAFLITDDGDYITTEGFEEKYDLELIKN